MWRHGSPLVPALSLRICVLGKVFLTLASCLVISVSTNSLLKGFHNELQAPVSQPTEELFALGHSKAIPLSQTWLKTRNLSFLFTLRFSADYGLVLGVVHFLTCFK